MVVLILIIGAMVLLAFSGTTVLSRTSRAAAYVTLADLIDGTLVKREAWPKHLLNMVIILLIHTLGLVTFVALGLHGISLVLQRFGFNIREWLS